jgi:hypothetical protein
MRRIVSFASEPEFVKNTRLNCGGVSSARTLASSMAGGFALLKKLL